MNAFDYVALLLALRLILPIGLLLLFGEWMRSRDLHRRYG
jgi:hypothetical protein